MGSVRPGVRILPTPCFLVFNTNLYEWLIPILMSEDLSSLCADLLRKLFEDYERDKPFDDGARNRLRNMIDCLPENACKRAIRDSLGTIATLYTLRGVEEVAQDREYHEQRQASELYVKYTLNGLRQVI